MGRKFVRNRENFRCEICGMLVHGTGYTDHCSKCLYSKHVDVNPGDRASECKGSMKPIRTEYQRGEFFIYYKCEKCRFKHKVHSAEEDNKELLEKLSE